MTAPRLFATQGYAPARCRIKDATPDMLAMRRHAPASCRMHGVTSSLMQREDAHTAGFQSTGHSTTHTPGTPEPSTG